MKTTTATPSTTDLNSGKEALFRGAVKTGPVYLSFNPIADGVVVPRSVRVPGFDQLCFSTTGAPLSIRSREVEQAVIVDGYPQRCVVPWSAVYMMRNDDGGSAFFGESIPDVSRGHADHEFMRRQGRISPLIPSRKGEEWSGPWLPKQLPRLAATLRTMNLVGVELRKFDIHLDLTVGWRGRIRGRFFSGSEQAAEAGTLEGTWKEGVLRLVHVADGAAGNTPRWFQGLSLNAVAVEREPLVLEGVWQVPTPPTKLPLIGVWDANSVKASAD